MHVLHKILVYIPDSTDWDNVKCTGWAGDEGILSQIRSYAAEQTAVYQDSVYDWRTTDTAGRWKNEYSKNVLLAANDKDGFIHELTGILWEQQDTIDSLVSIIMQGAGTADLATIAESHDRDSITMYLRILASMLDGEYTSDSSFYNTNNGSSRITEGDIRAVEKTYKDWALVMFDCHI